MNPSGEREGAGGGRLFMIAVPIGNLGDMTQRARELLSGASLIAAEDTRTAGLLLQRLGIKASGEFLALHKFSESSREKRVLDVLQSGKDVAVVPEAGTPGINDPGTRIAGAAAAAGFEVLAVPGPSAVTAALSVAGFDFERFTCLGFLPRSKSDAVSLLSSCQDPSCAYVFLESPKRIRASLELFPAAFGEQSVRGVRIALCREMTKMFEETLRGSYNELLPLLTDERLRGEYTVVFRHAGGSSRGDAAEVERIAGILAASGLGERTASDILSRIAGISRNKARESIRKGTELQDE